MKSFLYRFTNQQGMHDESTGQVRNASTFLVSLLTIVVALSFGTRVTAAEKPNIVLFYIDDMGWGEIAPFGHEANKTPNLDRMAAEGLCLRQYYTSNTACSPSRAAMLTGTHAGRIEMDGTVNFPGDNWGLNPSEITIAEMLKEQGYATACFGKWHLGDQPEFLPLAQGFDRYYGIPYSNDMWAGNTRGHRHTKEPYTPLPVVSQNQPVAYVADAHDQALLAETFTDKAIVWIEENKETPFFCYVPHAYVHFPRYARKQHFDRAEGEVNRSTTEEVDDSVGRILDTLRRLKLDQNTLVIFTSDNGGVGSPEAMGPLRGNKGGPKYEGHQREPMVVWWPGTVPAGAESDEITMSIDFLPSLAKLVGGNVPADRRIDGKDALDILLGKPGAKSPYSVVHYEEMGVRRGDWKLVRNGRDAKLELYNLSNDLSETINLASEKPELTGELLALCEAHAKDLVAHEHFRPRAVLDRPTAPLIPYQHDLPNLRTYLGAPTTETLNGAGQSVPEGEFGGGKQVGLAAKAKPNPKPKAKPAPMPSPPKVAHGEKPDVLFIAIDDMNDWTTLFDDENPIQTPNLKRLAARGTYFSQAYCASPGCNPSRTANMTGLRPTTSGVYGNKDAWREKLPDAVTLPQYFEQHGGYATRGAGKIYHHGGTGREDPDNPSFQEFFPKLGIRGPGRGNNHNGFKPEDKTPLANLAFDWGEHEEKMIDVDMCEWVEARMDEDWDQPLFLAAGIFNPHLPFYAPASTFARYPLDGVAMPPMPEGDLDDVRDIGLRMVGKERFVWEGTTSREPESVGSLEKMVQSYQAASDFADEMVGRLLDKLDESGRAENTIIVLWSDHGYHLGDKQTCVKFTLWEKANHIPFIIVAPGVGKPGQICDRPVSTIDLYPTLVELAGLPPKADNDGQSLVPLLKNPDQEWEHPALMTEGPGNHAVRSDRWRFIRYNDGTEELYDHDNDPWEHTNVADNPENAQVLAGHRKWLPKTEAPGIPSAHQRSADYVPPGKSAKPNTKNPKLAAKQPTGSPLKSSGYTPDKSDLLLAEFDGKDFGDWQSTGDAFGERPVTRDTASNRLEPFIGTGIANSFRPNDKPTGTLTSPAFKIERNYLHFLIGGGNHPDETGLRLLIDGEAVRTATGLSQKNNQNEEVIVWKSWDIAEFKGKKAQVKIFDHRSGGWGHIQVDHLFQSDRILEAAKPVASAPAATPANTVQAATSASFIPPAKSGVTLKDEWSTFPLYDQVGYDQPLRPQFHFTSRMGWLNDPNGMVFHDGEWHMLFQHNAKGNPSATKSWGNAVSTDLMHWEQLSHAINPYAKVDGSEGVHAIWSGSAVVDVNNALGKQKGDTQTLFAIYSATHEKFFQGGAYSTDKGRTWTKINDGKAIIPHQEGFSKGQRDPRVFYYAPGNFYVTIMMIGGPDRFVRLWRSTNLLDWEIIGDIPNKAAECIDMYAVPLDGDPENVKWIISDAGAHYEIGEFDGKTWKGFGEQDESGTRLKFDYGDAWYAAQAFNQGPEGRVVHVGWLRAKQPGYRPFLEAGMPFNQQMSIPIEITLKTTSDGIQMFRNPVQEIEELYARSESLENLNASDANKKLSDFHPELIDLTLRCSPGKNFTLNLRGQEIRYDATAQEFVFSNAARVEGEKAGWKKKGTYRDDGIRRIPAPAIEGNVTLRALVDRASLELFVNDGAAAASFVVVPDPTNRRIAIEGHDELKIHSLVVNELESAWGNGVAPAPPVAEDAKPSDSSSDPKPMPSDLLASSATPKRKLTPVQNPRSPGEQPNVVVIFIDDMGYGDIGPFGSDHPTPNLDRMAAEGIVLTDFYVSSTACTPSRSALLTGCYADRIQMGKSVVFPADGRGLNPDEITIADLLKQGGYATGCFGKWHLGDQPEFMPLAQGFDEYQGIPYSNDMWVKGNQKHNFPPLPWMVQNEAVAHIPDADSQARLTDALTDATVDFIIRHQDEPFFAYVPHPAVHSPHMVTPERLEASGGDVMRALIGEIDHSTGRILDTLRQLGLDENTFVLFTNDNGGSGKTSSGPLRGHKFGPKYEGHMRVATLGWWPGKIPAGSVSSEIGATIDLLPSIAKIADLPVPDDRVIDGHDISDILLGEPGAKSPHEILYYENAGARRGKWKLIHYPAKKETVTELYDLEADLGEQHNIADQHPDIVTELIASLEAHVADIAAGIRPAGKVENPKPLLLSSDGAPTLVEYLNAK